MKGKKTDVQWQEEAKVDEVVKVGVKLFKELGERTSKMEGQLGAYRQAMIDLAKSQGVEVPAFVTAEGGSLGEAGSAEQLRQWLEGVLSKATSPPAQGSRSRGRGQSGGRKGQRKGTTRDKGKRPEDRMDEGD